MFHNKFFIALPLVLLTSLPMTGRGSELRDLPGQLQNMLKNHEKMAVVAAEERGSQEALAKAWSAWFPQLRLTTSIGDQKGFNTTNQDFHLVPQERVISLDQTLWDFGKTSSEIGKAEAAMNLSKTAGDATRQTLLFEAGSALVTLCQAVGTVDLARKSVENIRKQTGLEQVRVDLGGGLPTDVLQSKSQLSGAEVRLVRAEKTLNQAVNRFIALFGELPAAPGVLYGIKVRSNQIPGSLEEILAAGLAGNLEIKSSELQVTMAQQERHRVAGSELYPRVSVAVEQRDNRQTDVTNVRQRETLAKVEANFHFDTGLGGVHALNAAREGVSAAQDRLLDTRNLILEMLRNAWDNLNTARRNARLLTDQTTVTEAFLRLARQERLIGRRSLVDVLSGETSLYNAQADSLSAQGDVIIATLSLLKGMARLETDTFSYDAAQPCLPAVGKGPPVK